jgi:hypothetical protein
MRSKAHTALTAPLVLHRIRIYKCAMKKIIFTGQMRNELFLLSSIILHWEKALWRLLAFVNCAMVLRKRLNFFFFLNGQRWTKCAMNILRSYLNWWHNWQLKNRRHNHTLKGSHSIGDGKIFLKTRRDISFNKVIWNEPTFGRIHLAGQ